MASDQRAARVAELVRQEVASLLGQGVKDPRIGFVSVMHVKMSSDLHYANVYVSLMGDEKEKKSSLIGLRQAAGYMRREVGKKLRLRYTPELRFFEDTTLDQAFHIDEVLKQLHEEDATRKDEDADA
ncbi:MAG: 30S ribosome-binding factor RbfA [Candidatus Hydrogenedentales bacterium]